MYMTKDAQKTVYTVDAEGYVLGDPRMEHEGYACVAGETDVSMGEALFYRARWDGMTWAEGGEPPEPKPKPEPTPDRNAFVDGLMEGFANE
jgi:hypothetical protein